MSDQISKVETAAKDAAAQTGAVITSQVTHNIHWLAWVGLGAVVVLGIFVASRLFIH